MPAPEQDAAAAFAWAAVLLAACGAVAVFSATAPLELERAVPPHFLRHLSAIGAGALLAFGASLLPPRHWRALAYPAWALSVAMLVAVIAVGQTANGAQRWLGVPGLGAFQPAEVAKLAVVLAVARLLAASSQKGELGDRACALALALAGVPALLCVKQPDLGNAVLMCAFAGVMLFVARAPWRWLAGPALLAAVGIGAYSRYQPYALRRWVGFLDPWAHRTTEGFQLVQSFVAFGRGALTGVGVGDGRQKLFYLPEAHTDFILSVVAEETGLVGVLVVLGIFVALLVAGLRVALRARDRFELLLGFGLTLLLVLPAALNAGVVMGCLPTKGLTLPFLSYGRSSLLVSCVAVGMLLGLARATKPARRPGVRR
jgi:cell division protein FtsW